MRKQNTKKQKEERSDAAIARNLSIPNDVWELAQRQAKASNRSVSNYLSTLVLKEAGRFSESAAAV